MYYLLPLCALLTASAAQGVGTPTHAIVLDVGNTSTRLNIYVETLMHSKYGPDLSVKQLVSKSFPPGLKTVLCNPSDLPDHLRKILDEAKKNVPSAYNEWTELHARVTSDLRFEDVKDMERILESLRDVLDSDRIMNPFKFERSHVQLLAGEDEGAMTWLSANFLLGALDKNSYQNETVGVIDMGSASTQITFVPDEPQYAEKYPLRFRKKKHQLYVQNYLQHGSESIYVKIHNVLVDRGLAEPHPTNPCMLEGDSREVHLSDGSVVTHIGSGNPRLCEEILHEIVKPHTGDNCQPKLCALGRVYQPRVKDVRFVATSGFVYTPTALGVVDDSKVLYPDRLRKAGHIYCRKTLSQVLSEYDKDPESASQDCLMSLYIPKLLHVAYGFSLDSRQITLMPDVEGEPVDWAHGFVLEVKDC